MLVHGHDADGLPRELRTDADGKLQIEATATISGVATAAKQDDLKTALQSATAHEAVTLGADFAITVGGGTARALFVGTGGNVKCTVGGLSLTYKNVPDGGTLFVAATLVSSTANGTTAADIVAQA